MTYLFIQHLYSTLFTNKYALMRYYGDIIMLICGVSGIGSRHEMLEAKLCGQSIRPPLNSKVISFKSYQHFDMPYKY